MAICGPNPERQKVLETKVRLMPGWHLSGNKKLTKKALELMHRERLAKQSLAPGNPEFF